MEKIYNLFKFIEDKYPQYKTPIKFKILNDIPLTKEELNIKEDLYLGYSIYLKSLPKGLTVNGALDLEGCESLTSLPEKLKVGWNLDLSRCTSLKSLPEELSVGNNLNLKGCISLESLPKGLIIPGDLRLQNCSNLESLPNDLRVLGGLYLKDTKIISKYTEAEIREMCPRIRGNIYL